MRKRKLQEISLIKQKEVSKREAKETEETSNVLKKSMKRMFKSQATLVLN